MLRFQTIDENSFKFYQILYHGFQNSNGVSENEKNIFTYWMEDIDD